MNDPFKTAALSQVTHSTIALKNSIEPPLKGDGSAGAAWQDDLVMLLEQLCGAKITARNYGATDNDINHAIAEGL